MKQPFSFFYQIGTSARIPEETRGISTKRTEHATDRDNCDLQGTRLYSTQFSRKPYTGNFDWADNKIRMTDDLAVNDHPEYFRQQTERRGRRNDTCTASLEHSLNINDDEEQSRNLSRRYYSQTVGRDHPRKSHVVDVTSLPNEENSSSLNIKITSTFSLNSYSLNGAEPTNLNPRTESQLSPQSTHVPALWKPHEQMETAMTKHFETRMTPFEVKNDRKGSRSSLQVPTFHVVEDHSQLANTRLGTRKEIVADNRWYKCGSPRLLFQESGIDGEFIRSKKKESKTKSSELNLHQKASIHFPGELENVFCRQSDHRTSRFSQTAPISTNTRGASEERCQESTTSSNPLPFATVKRTKQAQASDDSVATNMTTPANQSLVSSNSGNQQLTTVSSRWITCRDAKSDSTAQRRLVDYSGKVPLPWKLQQLSPESFHKFHMKNEAQQHDVSFDGRQHGTATAPLKKMDQVGQRLKKPLNWKPANPKRKLLSSQILITPAPILFENLKNAICSESDEEPTVQIPNYFLDFAIESTPTNPLKQQPEKCSANEKVSSRVSDETSQPDFCPTHKANGKSVNKMVTADDMHNIGPSVQHMKPRENTTKETPKLHEHLPIKKRATYFIGNSPPKDSEFHLRKNEETKSIPTSQVFSGVSCAPSVSEFPSPRTEEQSLLITTFHAGSFSKPYKRTGGAHPSIKPTADFIRLLPSTREIVCKHHTSKESVAPSNMDMKPRGTKRNFEGFSKTFRSAEFEREGKSSSTEDGFRSDIQDTRIPKNIHNLLELESSKFTADLTKEKVLFHRSGNRYFNGSTDEKIAPNVTETSVLENLTSELYEERKHQCEVCGRAFSRSNTLTTHKRIHTGDRPFPCDLCGKSFRQLGNLTRHKLTHTSFKPHACPKCSKSFTRTSNLNNHLQAHTNYKPFVCEFCGKGFHQKVDMKIHRYTHTGEKPHKCYKCGRGFKQLTHLKYHMRTHSDVRLFTCQHCGKGFNQKGNLQAHLHGHTGNRPYRCDICGKAFTLTSTLNTHMRTHASDKPFKCEFCEKGFYQKNALKTHYISSHPYTDGVCLL